MRDVSARHRCGTWRWSVVWARSFRKRAYRYLIHRYVLANAAEEIHKTDIFCPVAIAHELRGMTIETDVFLQLGADV